MPSYNIYLGDVNSGLSSEVKAAVQTTLSGWFSQIVPSGTTAIVSWTSSVPASIQSSELLVYFVRSSMDSVVRGLPGGPGSCGQRRRFDGLDEFADRFGSLCQQQSELSGGNGVSRIDAQQTASRRCGTSRPQRSGEQSGNCRNKPVRTK